MSHILIVDPLAIRRKVHLRLVKMIEADIKVEDFDDPAEALNWLKTHSTDLVLLAMQMRSMDASQFITALQKIPVSPCPPSLVLSQDDDRILRLRAFETGAFDHLTIPVDPDEFILRARRLLVLHHNNCKLITRLKDAEQELEQSRQTRARLIRESTQRLAQVIDSLPVLISATDPDRRILFVNAVHMQFARVEPAQVIGQPAYHLFGEDHARRSEALDRMVITSGRSLTRYEEVLMDGYGQDHVFLTTKSPLRDHNDQVTGVMTSSIEISDRKKIELHLHHMAHYDALTGLPNRLQLFAEIRPLILRARRGDQLFALHVIDIDDFKSIKDRLGHAGSDRFIIEIAKRLKNAMREHDVVTRLGTDTFGILQSHVLNAQDAADFADQMIAQIAALTQFEGQPIEASASIGIAIHPNDGNDAEDLLTKAELAMNCAKMERGNYCCFFTSDRQGRTNDEKLLTQELLEAFEKEQFVLFFQPQIDLVTGRIAGAEALLRWHRERTGLITPERFLASAEESGLIGPLNEWVLKQACKEARSWKEAGFGNLTVSVNLSPLQLREACVPDIVAKALAQSGLSGRDLELELTESILLHSWDSGAADLLRLSDMGVTLSVDGVGSNLDRIYEFRRPPVSRLKIDQSIIRNITHDPHDAALVRSIILRGHSLGLRVIGKGVETLHQLAILRAEQCDGIQGFYFGRPMRGQDFFARIREEQGSLRPHGQG